MTKRIITAILALLLLTLTVTGCQKETDTPFTPVVLDPDSIHEVADLTCSVYLSGETRILTGEKVYELYRLLFQETTDLPETTAEGYLVSNTRYYGFFGVYQSGYFSFSLSPLHSHAYEYQGEAGLYEDVMGYLE